MGTLVLCCLVILFMAAIIEQKQQQLDLAHALGPAVEQLLGHHERVRLDLLALEAELQQLIDAPAQMTRPELVAMIEASTTIRTGLQ